MDSLAELVPLLLVGAYYLLQGRRRAARRRAADAPPAASGEAPTASAPTPFQQFVAQINEAMAEAAGEPAEAAPPPVTEPPRRPETVQRPPLPAREFHAVPGSFDDVAPVDHTAHGFGPDNPLSEEQFERAPAFEARPRTRRGGYDPHGLLAAPPPERTASPLADLRARLRDPAAARESFLLQTIFGPRGGRRSDPR